MRFVAEASSPEDWFPWFVRVNNPSMLEMWENQPTFLIGNIVTITMAFLSLKFALKHGINNRYTYLWLAALLHGVVTETISYNLKEINSFWHSQTFLTFTGQRFPLYIVLFYPSMVVHAYIAASKLRLPWWAEPFAVGLFDVILDFPYDITGIKFVWWTWHDTDVHIFDRHYWVPWSSYFFHLSFHSSFTFLLNGSRYLLTGDTSKVKSHGFVKEMTCAIITALFSMAMATLTQIVPVMTIFKENLGIHSEMIVCIVIGIYVCIVWYADTHSKQQNQITVKSPKKVHKWYFSETAIAVTMHFVIYPLIVIYGKPENEVSSGIHEPLGPSSEKVDYYGASGQVYTKQQYFDPENYTEGYIDFHCAGDNPNIIKNPDLIGKDIYTVCGTPFDNRWEYIVMICAFSALGLFVYYNALSRSHVKVKHN